MILLNSHFHEEFYHFHLLHFFTFGFPLIEMDETMTH